MNSKNKIMMIFLLCFIFTNGWCDTNEEEQITIGGYTYSINRNKEDLAFFGQTAFESLDGIEQLKKLKKLIISTNTISLKDISAIGKLIELTELAIASEGGDLRIRDIIGASKLESLRIANQGTIDLEGVENFPELEEVLLTNCIPINYESLTRLKKLKRLVFVLPEQNTNLQFLTNIPMLEALTLDAANVVGDIYEPTTYIDIDVSFLQELKNLRSIGLSGFHIKNFNLLSEFPELNFIGIRRAVASDADYSLFRDDVNIIDYYDH